MANSMMNSFTFRTQATAQIITITSILWIVVFLTDILMKGIGMEAEFSMFLFKFMLPTSAMVWLYQPWSILSSMFLELKGDFVGFLFRMLILYQLGGLLQSYRGKETIWHLFIAGGLFGGLLHLFAYTFINYYTAQNGFIHGTSASVLAVVAGLGTFLPEYRVRLFLFGEVAMKWIAIVWVGLDLLMLPASGMQHFHHIGGAFYGFLYFRMYKQGVDFMKPWRWVMDKVEGVLHASRTQKRSVQSEYSKKKEGRVSEEELNYLLDKVAQKGYAALSRHEKERLEQASRQNG
jgi:membrane associated rhomboid family serine protease